MARGRGRAHPALRFGFSGGAHRRPRDELPIDGADPVGGGGPRREQPAPARKATAGRPRRGSGRPAVALRGGSRGNRGRRPGIGALRARPGRWPSSTAPTRSPAPSRRSWCAGGSLRRRRRNEVLRAGRGQGRPGVSASGVRPEDDLAFRRVVNVPARGIGAATLDRLAAAAREAGRSCGKSRRIRPG